MAAGKTITLCSELRKYLQERGIPHTNLKKAELSHLCSLANEIGLAIDPEGCIEDREEILRGKLVDGGTTLPNPAMVQGSVDLNLLPSMSFFDVCTYLMDKDVTWSAIRDYRRSEGYTMMRDGYVTRVEAATLTQGYFAIKTAVKPRTRDRDPISGSSHYYPWNISRIFFSFGTHVGSPKPLLDAPVSIFFNMF